MTSYGTIPTSSSPSGPPVNLEYITRAKERIKAGLGTRRPWREMFRFHSFSLPRSFREVVSREKTNLGYFQMNYVIVVLGIVFLSLLWHPISLIVFIVMLAIWLFLYFLRDEPLVIFGRLISDRVVMILLSVVTLVALLLTHATKNILVSLLVAVVVVLIHAAVRKTDDLSADEEAAGGLLR
ncbi:PRA1 family protein F2-like [Andrographis paniculata]|uniref:PRA1 family protein F2-like n=1 Tax=Andrographis paniculata TaxID=175694 RepID=UPI0021E75E84|nr:PRA1 family protein F2-like [Andrographis paniculata]